MIQTTSTSPQFDIIHQSSISQLRTHSSVYQFQFNLTYKTLFFKPTKGPRNKNPVEIIIVQDCAGNGM